MKRILATVIAALVISACGPIYNTEYTYIPPADTDSRACIAQCNNSKGQCQNNAQLRADNERLRCDVDASIDYERCIGHAANDAARAQCVKRSCAGGDVDDSRCDADFRVCFQSCGGIVQSRQVCTFNCGQ